LDRGELDKFIQQSEQLSSSQGFVGGRAEDRIQRPAGEIQYTRETRAPDHYDRHRQYHDDQDRGYKQPVKKKESFWGELFDFG
jgi:Zn-finger nucleic acid-binding protein